MFQQTKQTPIKYGINPIALKFKWHNLENPDSLSSSDFVFLTLLMYTRTAIKWAAISAVQLQHSHPMLLRGGKPHKTFNLDFMLHANLNISQTHPGTCSNASKELKDLNTKRERQTVHGVSPWHAAVQPSWVPGKPTFEESSQDGHLDVVLPFRAHAEHSDLKGSTKPTTQNYNTGKRDTEHVDRTQSRMVQHYLFCSLKSFQKVQFH